MMAIRRCPYCKAIIEEGAEYCSNCGTQLLFPEDEDIDEEIPGEEIVDDESDEEELIPPEEGVEEEIVSDEIPDVPDSEEIEEPEKKERDYESEDVPSQEEKGQSEPAEGIEGGLTEANKKSVSDESDEKIHLGEKDAQEALEESKEELENNRDEILNMEDLEKAIESTELEKQEIEEFLDSIRKDRGEIRETSSSKEKMERREEEREADFPQLIDDQSDEGEIIKEDLKPTTDTLPPWAAKMRGEPPASIPLTQEEREEAEPSDFDGLPAENEETSSEEFPPLDTGVGLPEGVAQKDLPFNAEMIKTVEKEEKVYRRPSPRLSSWIKSRIFDVLFIAAVWLITVWITSYVMEVGFFRLISKTALPLGLFYIILLAGYFFLSFFFLGETLGDYLFNPQNRSEPPRPV